MLRAAPADAFPVGRTRRHPLTVMDAFLRHERVGLEWQGEQGWAVWFGPIRPAREVCMRASTSGADTRAFTGFEPADYQVFGITDFAKGMAAIRSRVTPKLTALGETLAPRLTAAVGEPFFPHVAKHARRTVNTPPETWMALGRDPRKYKAYAFLGVIASGRGVDVRLVLKDEAEVDKATLAGALVRERKRLPELLATTQELGWYLGLPGKPRKPQEGPIALADLPGGFFEGMAETLRTRKSAIVDVGMGWPREDRRLAGPEFERLALRAMASLYPLYRLATRPGARLDGQVRLSRA